MKYIIAIFCILMASICVEVRSNLIEDIVTRYFKSETTTEFQRKWEIYRKSFENAIKLALKETYGRRKMNIYKKRAPDNPLLAEGFFLSDDVVQLLLLNLTLRELPHMRESEVAFRMDRNCLSLDGSLTKMFVEADYLLFRNHSSVLDAEAENQDPYKVSPFSFQQVQTVGKVAITADHCRLSGSSVTTLMGSTVNLGHSTFMLTDCKFDIEIYSLGSGLPPVMTPYFSNEQGDELKRLLSKPIVDEINTKLQGALFSLVNTSMIFGKDLMRFRHHQEKVFKKTSEYMTTAVRHMNEMTVNRNRSKIQLADFNLYWNEKLEVLGDETDIKLTDMALSGWDTAYSANIGGPYETYTMRIGETIRYNTMHLQGKMHFERGEVKGIHDFAAELHDVSVAVMIKISMVHDKEENLKPLKDVNKYVVVDWRVMDYFIKDIDLFIKERITSHALLTGYLINQIPKWIIKYISEAFLAAALNNKNSKKWGTVDMNSNTKYEERDINNDELDQPNDPNDNMDEENQNRKKKKSQKLVKKHQLENVRLKIHVVS